MAVAEARPKEEGDAPAGASACSDASAMAGAPAQAAKKLKKAGGGKEAEEALRNLRSLHVLLSDLEQEMKVFQNVPLPTGDVAQELAHAMAQQQPHGADPFPTFVEMKKRMNLAIASEYDKIKGELDKSYTQQIQPSEGGLYALQRALFSAMHFHARYVALICALLAKKPAWVSENKYVRPFPSQAPPLSLFLSHGSRNEDLTRLSVRFQLAFDPTASTQIQLGVRLC